MKVVITVSDGDSPYDVAEYVRLVGDLIADGYTSGHTDALTHWEMAS